MVFLTTSRSLFSNTIVYTGQRSIMNPIGNSNIKPSANTICVPFTLDGLKVINDIDASYGINLANKTYDNIPADYQAYVDLYNILANIAITTTDTRVSDLLTAAQHLLDGAINAFGLYSENLMLARDKTILQNKITDILSGKNVSSVNVEPNGGSMVLTKTFTLAAVFNYYILIYGMPEYGVGFDPIRIEFLIKVLNGLGIDPFK